MSHVPVLLDEVLTHLNHKHSGVFVDATFGRGGHSRAWLNQLDHDASLIGIDQDPEAISAGEELAQRDSRFRIVHARFGDLKEVLANLGVEKVQGVLMDIGVSSPQLDNKSRGFSFLHDGPLDMRMDPSSGTSAAQLLSDLDEDELVRILFTHGEEKFARRIARAIQQNLPITRTVQLAEIIGAVVPNRAQRPGKHPATKTFQALRIVVNQEHVQLEQGLQGAFEALAEGGRLAVISFHSLEDRVVKKFFQRLSKPPALPRRVPVQAQHLQSPPGKLIGRAIKAAEPELANNPRARSATLRVVEKQVIHHSSQQVVQG